MAGRRTDVSGTARCGWRGPLLSVLAGIRADRHHADRSRKPRSATFDPRCRDFPFRLTDDGGGAFRPRFYSAHSTAPQEGGGVRSPVGICRVVRGGGRLPPASTKAPTVAIVMDLHAMYPLLAPTLYGREPCKPKISRPIAIPDGAGVVEHDAERGDDQPGRQPRRSTA